MLAFAWHSKGIRIEVQKWVSTGDSHGSEDIKLVYEAMARPVPEAGLNHAPYCLKFPASPHLAAKLEGIHIDKERLVNATHALEAVCDILLIEGAGGPFSPISHDLLFAELIKELSIPVILVTTTSLGTINQTLVHLEALGHRGIQVIAVIFNETSVTDPLIAADSMDFIAKRTDIPTFGPIPHMTPPFPFTHQACIHTATAVLGLLEAKDVGPAHPAKKGSYAPHGTNASPLSLKEI